MWYVLSSATYRCVFFVSLQIDAYVFKCPCVVDRKLNMQRPCLDLEMCAFLGTLALTLNQIRSIKPCWEFTLSPSSYFLVRHLAKPFKQRHSEACLLFRFRRYNQKVHVFLRSSISISTTFHKSIRPSNRCRFGHVRLEMTFMVTKFTREKCSYHCARCCARPASLSCLDKHISCTRLRTLREK
jgi:hypothetical protein